MYWLEQLKKFKAEKNMTYKNISDKTGIPMTTLEKLFLGRTKDPKLITIDKIARCLGYSVADVIGYDNSALTENEEKLIISYRELDLIGRSRVERLTLSELERVRSEQKNPKRFPAIYFDFPVSAGTGEFLDHTTARVARLSVEPPRGTSYILRVAGDSMEPEYNDGDIVCVRDDKSLEFGDIGIFSYCGNVYIKEYTPEGLKSLNPKYGIIPAGIDILPLGKVLCRMDGSVIA